MERNDKEPEMVDTEWKAIVEVDPPVRAAETTAQPNPFQMFELQIMSKIG